MFLRNRHLPQQTVCKKGELRKLTLPPLPSMKDLLRIYRLRSVRQLAQNFIINERVASSIATALGPLRNSFVYEIGPGPGIITRAIMKQGVEKVVCVEKDFRFLPILSMLQSAALEMRSEVLLYTEDCLTHDFSLSSNKIFQSAERAKAREWHDKSPNLFIMGNLPFNVSLPFLVRMLHDMDSRHGLFQHGRVKMAFTFQREIAEQIVADVSAPKRGRLSLMAQNMCHVKHAFNISNRAFVPRPACETGVVLFEPRVNKLVPDVPLPYFEKLVKAIMHYKSKHFVKGLQDLFPRSVANQWALQVCSEAGVAPTTLPRNLDFQQLQRVALVYLKLCEKYQDLFEFNYQQPKINVPVELLRDSRQVEEDTENDEKAIMSTSVDDEIEIPQQYRETE